MNHHYLTHTIFLSCILAGFGGAARADVVQCIDETGAVTYTDVPCENGTDVTRASGLINHPTARASTAPSANSFAVAEKIRADASARKIAAKRGLSLDVATLREARSSMLLQDQAASMLRQHKLAALDPSQRSPHWYNF